MLKILHEADLIFGKFDIQNDSFLINHILFLGNRYIHSGKGVNGMPSLQKTDLRHQRIVHVFKINAS